MNGRVDWLAGEVLGVSAPFLEKNIHPITIIKAYKAALEDALEIITGISKPVNTVDRKEMLQLIQSSIGTKVCQLR
jgi:T-complex protein 1 subunit gamma